MQGMFKMNAMPEGMFKMNAMSEGNPWEMG